MMVIVFGSSTGCAAEAVTDETHAAAPKRSFPKYRLMLLIVVSD
jgi:hypothetical protein